MKLSENELKLSKKVEFKPKLPLKLSENVKLKLKFN